MRKSAIIVLTALITLAFSGLSSPTVTIVQDPELWLAAPILGTETPVGSTGGGISNTAPYELKGIPLGTTFTLGSTWCDYQHNGTIEKMIHLSADGGVHFCWMNGLEAQAVNRHVYYNYYNPATGTLNWPDVGYQVDQGNRAGYTTITALNGGEAVVAYHSRTTASADFNTQIAYDFLPGFGAFQLSDIANLAGWAEIIWPHVTVDQQNYIHVMSCENNDESWNRIVYSRSEDGAITFTPFANVDTIMTISQAVAASPVSNKVGIIYTRSEFDPVNLGPYDGLLVSQMNNGIAIIESEDGVTWDFDGEQDLTKLVAPDSSYYPDSTAANGDSLRAYCDVSLLYDYDDRAHAAFTTRGFWFDARLAAHPDSFAVLGMTLDASVIWHWSEEHDSLTVVADGWYDVGDPDVGANEHRGSGAWRSTVDRPSLGINPKNGYIYCTYQRCVEGDTSGGPIPSHGFANGEIFCSVSTDGGLNWSMPVNLTNTPSPNAWAGQCMDEDYSSLASVVNDTLHILYIEDKDAGGVVMTAPQEGTWTLNPVKYLKVPADLVPPGPPYVPNFNFHVVRGATSAHDPSRVSGAVPQSFALHQNYPNPFNPRTTILFDLAQDSPVTIRIYNVSGQLIRELANGRQTAGSYEVVWDGRNSEGQALPSGIYFYQMRAGQFSDVKKMALIK